MTKEDLEYNTCAHVCWVIWKERNDKCFEGITNAVEKLKYKCMWLLAFWCNLLYVKDEHKILDFIET